MLGGKVSIIPIIRRKAAGCQTKIQLFRLVLRLQPVLQVTSRDLCTLVGIEGAVDYQVGMPAGGLDQLVVAEPNGIEIPLGNLLKALSPAHVLLDAADQALVTFQIHKNFKVGPLPNFIQI